MIANCDCFFKKLFAFLLMIFYNSNIIMIKRNIAILLFISCVTVVGVLSQPVLAACAGAETSFINCDGNGQNAIIQIVKNIIKIMTAGVMVVAVGAVIIGSIIYMSSEGSPDKITKAHTIWMNTLYGVLAFTFMVALTNFIIPGGAF